MFNSPFTASRWQVATYFLGVALFSISFLVFLNSSLSFVITDLIGSKTGVGDAVGTLGFADELVAIVTCPFWGLLSDRIGVRNVSVVGYAIVGLSLYTFVQARNVYPQLLLARLFFSVGAAATSTMVTAVLPTMTMERNEIAPSSAGEGIGRDTAQQPLAINSNFVSFQASRVDRRARSLSSTSQVAGFVGTFTGLGALLALGIFLPLPVRLQKDGNSPANAVTYSYYIVGAVAFIVSFACFIGLRGLPGENEKKWRRLVGTTFSKKPESGDSASSLSYPRLLFRAASLGLQDEAIGLGYLGGFVARASSVGITLFIPLFVNAHFVSSGLCKGDPHSNPAAIKDSCRRAYVVASMLAGLSQLIALVTAPILGYLDAKYWRYNAPLLISAALGVAGYIAFAHVTNPDPGSETGTWVVFFIMGLIGISQIGAIVCSLSLLSRGIQNEHIGRRMSSRPRSSEDVRRVASGGNTPAEASPLLSANDPVKIKAATSRSHMKGSIAGVYSLAGGLGILLLTKIGGLLFDRVSTSGPFYMLASFNAVLLLVGAFSMVRSEMERRNTNQA